MSEAQKPAATENESILLDLTVKASGDAGGKWMGVVEKEIVKAFGSAADEVGGVITRNAMASDDTAHRQVGDAVPLNALPPEVKELLEDTTIGE